MNEINTHKPVVYFAGLNGIRAIAAFAVLFAHVTQSLGMFGLDVYVFGKMEDGGPRSTLLAGFGVSMFFALSGFLITYLLLLEKQTGTINVKNFYIRRILRIWPLYFLYLAITLITLYVYEYDYERSSIFYYVFLAANVPFILGSGIPFVEHYWSLGVEEQFYLFWPWIVRKAKKIFRFSLLLTIGLILLKLVFRIVEIKTGNGIFYLSLHVTRFHCMLIGALGAIALHEQKEWIIRILGSVYAQVIAWLIILLTAVNIFHVASVIDNEILSLVTVVIIFGQIQQKNRFINLDTKLFDLLGKISYGIYVIHPLMIFFLSKVYSWRFENTWMNYVSVYLLSIVVTVLLAYLSYTFFESPFLRMKERFAKIKSSNTK